MKNCSDTKILKKKTKSFSLLNTNNLKKNYNKVRQQKRDLELTFMQQQDNKIINFSNQNFYRKMKMNIERQQK